MYIDHRYEVLESLGSGTWANVFRVRDIRTDIEYTLKLFQYLASSDLYERFSAEDMHHITKIEHPNLTHVVDFGHVGDHVYFISDYFNGSTLNSFRFSKIKIDQLYDIVVQICYALDALHNQNILHKDLKLENILFSQENNAITVKLIDFGFSKIDLESDPQQVSGTLPYMAPELYQGKQADNTSDFYSLGVILYKITTGSFPYNLNQINALMTGNQQYFIPVFPSELNPDIPADLEKFILRLLEKNPINRFQSCKEIITYINRIQNKKYSFSVSWSMVNSLRFNSYQVHERISHDLTEFVSAIEQNNGKLISLIGGDGLGKDNILSLFRYHILNGHYFIFDFNCTRTEHEAFFALIKEFIRSMNPKEIDEFESLKLISEKFRKYLFQSESEAKAINQSQEELKIDFESVKNILIHLSKIKPIIFIVRNFQHVHRYTIEFINYLSPFIVDQRMLIVLSSNDFSKINQIEHSILTHIPNLSLEESTIYISKLLRTTVPEVFCSILHHRASGNPMFIQEILIDLVSRKKIIQGDDFDLQYDFTDYTLPSRLLHSVYSRMSHISQANYKLLQKLAIAQTPLSRELILHILSIKDKELYNLLNDAIFNEILVKRDKYYYFAFDEAKKRLFDECSASAQISISQSIVQYFQDKSIQDKDICQGVIANAIIAKDFCSQRAYTLRLYEIYNEVYDQTNAYNAILDVIKLDFNPLTKTSQTDMIKDLTIFQSKIELTGYLEKSDSFQSNLNKLPDLFEKYLLIGTMQLVAEEINESEKSFKLAESLAMTGKQRILIWLYYTQIYARKDLALMKEYIDKAEATSLPLDFQISFVDRKAVYYKSMKDVDRAIKTIETFISTLASEHEINIMIRLASLHNNLGVFYGDQKNIAESDEHLNAALSIWKRYNITRYLGLIYNNMSDLYLKQGATVMAEYYSELAYQKADSLNLNITKALALLNQGEAKIKMGAFIEAEQKLLEAKAIIVSVGSTRFLDSIQRNLALSKSKIGGFGHYYNFIVESEPDIIDGFVREINPLVKTYFYYLFELRNAKKLKKLISKNVQINYSHIHEEEFYHNLLSMVAILENNYEGALEQLKLALRYAGEISNNYAVAVVHMLQINCYFGLGDNEKARELIEIAKPIIIENRYRYWLYKIYVWELKLDLQQTDIPLRLLLRRTVDLLNETLKLSYYQISVELYQIKIQLLLLNSSEEAASEVFNDYKMHLEAITVDIGDDDRQNYLNINLYNLKSIKKFEVCKIASRAKNLRNKWNDLLYNIANVSNEDRIKFLIEKGLNQVISPYQYRLMEYSEKISSYITFSSFNCEKDNLIIPEFNLLIERAFKNDNLVITKYNKQNLMVIPLKSGFKRIGYLLITDNGEQDFTKQEISIMRNVKQHLTALIIRIQDYIQITKRIEKMNQLMNISHELMKIVDINDLEHEIVSYCIDFTNSTRGFLIKKDSEGNYTYKVNLDQSKQLLQTISGISKTALSRCQSTQEPVITFNAVEDNRFKSSISVQDYVLHSIFCTPIIVDNSIYGFLYLDNINDNSREMYLNNEIIDLLQEQIKIALKNAMQYDAVIKKSSEMLALDTLKDEFMAIVSHELNTPLTTLQSYVSRLKRNLFADEEEKSDIILKIEAYVKKLILTTNDITTMNNYNLKKTLLMTPVDIEEILMIIHQEVEILSRNRKMFIKIEVEKDLPKLQANWEALHLMIYNIVLNSIRFTNDFGTITISARRSAFQQEKIEGKESLVIIITDNGIGIPEHQIKNVFRKFYEVNEIYAHKSGTIEYRSSGLGLGLSTSKRIVELHNGTIWIKSKENEGSSVFIAIPFKTKTEQQI